MKKIRKTFFIERVLGMALVSWATDHVGVHRLFPFSFQISVFLHPLFFACHRISFVILLYDYSVCTHLVDPSLTHFFRRVFMLGTGSGTRCCGPRGRAGVRMKQKSHLKFLLWPGFEPRTLQSNGRKRYH